MAALGRLLRSAVRLPALSVYRASASQYYNTQQRILKRQLLSLPNTSAGVIRCFSLEPAESGQQVDNDPSPAVIEPSNTVREPSSVIDANAKFHEMFRDLHNKAQNWGNIHSADIHAIMKYVKREKIELSEFESLELLRWTGKILVKESLNSRVGLSQRMLGILEARDVPQTLSFRNMLLRVKIENKESFVLSDYLKEMEETYNVIPDRTTYQLAALKYCTDGDIQSASVILEHMKSQNYGVAMNVFHALIRALVAHNDQEGLASMMDKLQLMFAKMDGPYKAMMLGHAERGDVDNIHKVLTEAQQKGVPITFSILDEVCETLAVSGHAHLLNQVVPILKTRKSHDFYRNLHPVFRMIAEGYTSDALYVFRELQPDGMLTSARVSQCKSLLKEILRHKASLEDLEEVTQCFEAVDFQDPVQFVMKEARTFCSSDNVNSVLHYMQKKNVELDYTTCRILCRKLVRGKNVEGLYTMAAFLNLNSFSAGKVLSLTQPCLTQLGESYEEMISRFEDLALRDNVTETLKLAQALSEGNYSNIGRSNKWVFGTYVNTAVVRGLRKHQDLDGCITGLSRALTNVGKMTRQKIWSALLESVCDDPSLRTDPDTAKKVLTAYAKSADVVLSDTLKARLIKNAEELNLEPESIEQPESLLAQLSDQSAMSRTTLASHALRAAKQRKDLDEALMYKTQLEENHVLHHGYRDALLHITILLLEQNRVDEAFAMVEDYSKRHGNTPKKVLNRSDPCGQIGASLSLQASPEVLSKFTASLASNLCLVKISGPMTRSAMAQHINNGDVESAVRVLDVMVADSQQIDDQSTEDILSLFITSEDSHNLQKVVARLETVQGRSEVLARLTTALIVHNKVTEAAHVIETGNVDMKSVVTNVCKTIKKTKDLGLVSRVFELPDHILSDQQKNTVLYEKIRINVASENLDEVQATLDFCSQKNITPSARIMNFVSQHCKEIKSGKHNLQPTTQAETDFVQTITSTLEPSALVAALGNAKDQGQALSPGFLSRVGVYMARKSNRDLRQLLAILAEDGDIESIDHLSSAVKRPGLIKMAAAKRIASYIHSGRAEELVAVLEEKPSLLDKQYLMSMDNYLLLAEKSPDLMPRYESLVRSYTKQTSAYEQIQQLRAYLLLTEQAEQENELVKDYPLIADRAPPNVLFGKLCEDKKEEMMNRIVDKFSNKPHPGMFRNAIQLKCELEKWDEVVNLYHTAKSNGLKKRDVFRMTDIRLLEEHLLASGQPLPWTDEQSAIEDEQTVSQDEQSESSDSHSDSSDSSDSDSDEPTQHKELN